MLDLVSTLSSIIEAKLDAMENSNPSTALDWDELQIVNDQIVGELCDISEQDPWVTISTGDSLTHALTLMEKKSDIHRLAVIDEDTKEDPLVGLITQSSVLHFIYNNLDKLPSSKKDLPVNVWHKSKSSPFREAVETVLITEPTFKAFRKISQKEITGLAVVNSKGDLCGSLSASDLKYSSEETVLTDLYLPVGQYIVRKKHKQQGTILPENSNLNVITCTPQDSLSAVITKLVQSKVHRIFVVAPFDEDSLPKPQGVISLCDIFTVLLSD